MGVRTSPNLKRLGSWRPGISRDDCAQSGRDAGERCWPAGFDHGFAPSVTAERACFGAAGRPGHGAGKPNEKLLYGDDGRHTRIGAREGNINGGGALSPGFRVRLRPCTRGSMTVLMNWSGHDDYVVARFSP